MPPEFQNNIPPVNNQTNTEPIRRWKWVKYVLLLLVIFAGAIFALYIWIDSQFDDLDKPIQNLTASSTDQFADWKTYTNTEYGFELKIPNNWTVSEISKKPNLYQNNLVFLSPNSKRAEADCINNPDCSGEIPFFDIAFNNRDQSLGDLVTNTNIKKINGTDFTIYTLEGLYVYYVFQTKKDGEFYSFTVLDQNKYSQILSTFKFTK